MGDAHHDVTTGSPVDPVVRRRDAWLGCVFTLFGVAMLVWVIPAQVRDAGSFGLPPSFTPRILAWTIIGFGALLFAINARTFLRDAQPSTRAAAITWRNVRHLALTMGAVLAMLVLMKAVGDRSATPFTGFLVAAPPGLVAFTMIHRGAPLWAYALNALALPLVIYLIFWLLLDRPLP